MLPSTNNFFNFGKKKIKLGCVSDYTFAGRVKQRSLERDNLHVIQVFLDGHLDCESSIWIHIGEGQQICGANKEIPVERVDGQPCRERHTETKSNKLDLSNLHMNH